MRRRAPARGRVLASRRWRCCCPGAARSRHAQLEGDQPRARARSSSSEPAAVVFRFDEPVEGNFGAVRVYDAERRAGRRRRRLPPRRRQARGSASTSSPACPTAATPPPTGWSPPTATSSPAASSSRSARPGTAPSETVAELTGGPGSGPVTETAFGIARGLAVRGDRARGRRPRLLLLVWLPALARGRRRRARAGGGHARLRAAACVACCSIAAGVGAVSAAAGVVLEGAEAAGISGFSALKETIVRETLETRFGTVWGLRAARLGRCSAVAAAAVLLRPGRRPRRRAGSRSRRRAARLRRPRARRSPATAAPSPRSRSLFPVNVLHVLAMAVWLGGLAALLFVVAARRPASSSRADRSRLLAAALSRASRRSPWPRSSLILITGLSRPTSTSAISTP